MSILTFFFWYALLPKRLIYDLKKCVNHHSAPLCEISNNAIENFLKYIEISWFYVDSNHSFGEVCSSTNRLISSSKGIELSSLYTILQIFTEIRRQLFEIIDWQILKTDRQTDTQIQTRRWKQNLSKNKLQSFWARL